MDNYPDHIESEEALEEVLSRPSSKLIALMAQLKGDIIFLGVSGKMGISMTCMAKRACEEAGVDKRILGVSRFSESGNKSYLEERGIEILSGDLLDPAFLNALPDFKNLVHLAGIKFGTQGNEANTWAMNVWLPGMVAEKFKNSRIVALSTGCVYPLVNVESGGSVESDPAGPVGEYAQSCLGRERAFEYGSEKHGTSVVLIRLNYSVETRYGVLVDVANKVLNEQPVDVTMGFANVIWQGDANDLILRCFDLASSPAHSINVTGPETLSIRKLANQFGEIFGKKPNIIGTEQPTALLSNAGNLFEQIGKPRVSLEQVIGWTAEWICSGKRLLGKPTHFEARDGNF
tara:strand:+ start:721 stop:1758 length:1038 start_codon:yes stop_codon:yes gene_type:complete